MLIDPNTRLYGVVGNPLRHTLSPALHNAAFAAMGLNAVYLAFETRDIAGALEGVRALGLKGLSITLPYKSAVIPLMDEVEDPARQIGAVNTVVNRNGRLIGSNTDAAGALQALGRCLDPAGRTALHTRRRGGRPGYRVYVEKSRRSPDHCQSLPGTG